MHPKLKMLKEVLRQMQCAMADGEGDSETAGKEAMEDLGGGLEETKVAADKEEYGGEDEDYGDEKKDFMKRGKKLPSGGKGSAMIMAKMMMKKPEGKKLKYG